MRSGQIAAGTKININQLVSTQYGTMKAVLVTHGSAVAGRAPRLGPMRNGQFEQPS